MTDQPTHRKPWSEFADIKSTPATKPQAEHIDPRDLVDMADYRINDRHHFGVNVLESCVAYAQDSMIFDDHGKAYTVDKATYTKTPRNNKLNKFHQAYRDNAKIWLHKSMADIIVDAAIYLYTQHQWTSMLYDGLRTVNGAYNMYINASDSDLEGLLALPGDSAHNKAMAADLIMFDKNNMMVPMGGNFDDLNLATNHRHCTDLPHNVQANRIKRECAFQHAALMRGRLFAPLPHEFWDERFPQNHTDHWRVLDSLARCLGVKFLSDEDSQYLRCHSDSPERRAFKKKWHNMHFDTFTQHWHNLFDDQDIRSKLNLPEYITLPPSPDSIIYHGDFQPLYDRELIPVGKNQTDNELDETLKNPELYRFSF